MKAIPLVNNRDLAIVDDEDFNFLSRFRWYLIETKYHSYAKTFDIGDVFMHQLIMGLPLPPMVICHLDDIGLHNFKSNLKATTQSENIGSACDKKRRQYNLPRGVSRTLEGSYRVRITIDGVRLHLGTFRTLERAIKVYEEKQKELPGGV
jgi:hypothetical protein